MFACVHVLWEGNQVVSECVHMVQHTNRPALAQTEKTKISGSRVTSAEILEASTATLNTVFLKEDNNGEAQVDPK